ncbi:hypothetical protein HMPRFS0000_1523 [Staphylococcus aureus]|nr:hypothetical protein HMPRFS0000_1523 [Staphylococcus aureus]
MNSNTNAEKVVSEKDGLVKHNIKVEPSNDFKPEKGDFVKLVLKMMEDIYKQEMLNIMRFRCFFIFKFKKSDRWEWDRNDKEPLMIYYVVVLTH